MNTAQLTIAFSLLMVATFAVGCGYGYTFSRNKHRKVSHARKR